MRAGENCFKLVLLLENKKNIQNLFLNPIFCECITDIQYF